MAQPRFIETLVTSTRMRLARNLSAYPFPHKLNEKLAKEIVYLVENELQKLDNFQKNDMSTLSAEEATLLQEQHLISPALIKKKGIGSAFISADRSMSVMVNEEDHLREQYIYKGFDLYKAYEQISGVDEALGNALAFAYDKRLGYLTACPSNLGTGMRASVMMFLPGLAWSKELEEFLPKLKAGGLTVRGVFGEGTVAEGYNYQVSNERTLGVSEQEILEEMTRTTMTICDLEIRAREEMKKRSEILLRDKCLRAYGALTHCALLTSREFSEKMLDVRLGTALGFFEIFDSAGFEDFFTAMRPATFRVSNGLQGLNERKCDEIRAETVGNALPELVRITRKK